VTEVLTGLAAGGGERVAALRAEGESVDFALLVRRFLIDDER
jgi:hypothetical protein